MSAGCTCDEDFVPTEYVEVDDDDCGVGRGDLALVLAAVAHRAVPHVHRPPVVNGRVGVMTQSRVGERAFSREIE